MFPFDKQEPATSSLQGELNYLLAPFGIEVPPPRHNVMFPEPGSPNFFGRHPGLTSAIENGLMAAAFTPSGNTVGENISNVARSLLTLPRMRQQLQLDPLIAPLQFASQVGNLRKVRNEAQLSSARIANENAQTELYKAQTKVAQEKPQHLAVRLTSEQANEIGLPQLSDQTIPFSDIKDFFKTKETQTDVIQANGRVLLINKRNGNTIRDLGQVTYKPDSDRKPEYRASLRLAEQRKHQALGKAERDFRDSTPGFDGLPNYAFNNQDELLRRKQAAQDAYEEEITALTGSDVTGSYRYQPSNQSSQPSSQPKPQLTFHPDGTITIK